MAFVQAAKAAMTREELKERTLARAEILMEADGPLPPDNPKIPWRASDIKNPCPRQVFYSRNYKPSHEATRVGAPALFGSVVHEMFQVGAHDDEDLWEILWEDELGKLGIDSLHDPLIDWRATAKPFSLSGFQNASPDAKVWALYKRYKEMDRLNYRAFWSMYPFAVYRHPPTGRLAQEEIFRSEIDGEQIVTTADMILTDVYTGEIVVADWKTGRASEMTQLATYAIVAEKVFDLPEGTIQRGFFILTGQGDVYNDRGKLPHKYVADPERAIVMDYLDPWRETVRERVENLRYRAYTGTWTPVFNSLCYRACSFRDICPIGRALDEVRSEKEDAKTSSEES